MHKEAVLNNYASISTGHLLNKTALQVTFCRTCILFSDFGYLVDVIVLAEIAASFHCLTFSFA